MNSSLASSVRSSNDTFIIADYLELLTKSEKEKTKYICPVCEGHKLSINKNGKGYTCYDGCDGKKIAYKLRELNGEFKPKKESAINDLLQVYKQDAAKNSGNGKSGNQNGDEVEKLSNNVSALKYIKGLWGDDLKFNLRTLEIELKGQKIDCDSLHSLLADKYNKSITKERCIDSVYYLAKQKEYDPFKDYLESCKGKETWFTKKGIAFQLFKIDDPYYDELTWLFLLAVVKRVYEPGCKWDMAFVLQGEQEIGKSTFFRTIANGSFSDGMTDRLSVEDMRIMQGHAINEWSELDGFTAKTYEGKIKAFLSRQEDQFRLPYAKGLITYPRSSVIVGSVNEAQFLTDMTGNRRFGVVPVDWIVPPDELELFRDELWAGVIEDYEQNWQGKHQILTLPKEYRDRQKSENERFLVGDILEEAIAEYVDGITTFVTTGEIAKHLLGWKEGVLGVRASEKGTQMRIAKILNRLGWVKKLKRIGGGNPQKVWVRKDANW